MRKKLLGLLFVFALLFSGGCGGGDEPASAPVPGAEAGVSAASNAPLPPAYTGSDILRASRMGEYDTVERLVNAGANVELSDAYGNTVLILAAKAGDPDIVDLLIGAGADVNRFVSEIKFNTDGAGYYGTVAQFALQAAATGGDPDTVELLLQGGADIEMSDNGGGTALMSAVSSGKFGAAEMLIRYGADVNAINDGGGSPLSLAGSTFGQDREKMIELLKDSGAWGQ